MTTSRTRQAGFSLLELVIATGLFTVVMGVVFQFVVQSQKSFAANQAVADAHENADFASLRVAEILRGAGANPANIPSINSLSFLKYTSPNNHSSVDILSDLNGNGNSNDNIDGSAEFSSRFYILTSENVTLRHNAWAQTIELVDHTAGASSSVTLVEHIKGFEVEILENSRDAKITITAGSSAGTANNLSSVDATYTVVSEVKLRNRF